MSTYDESTRIASISTSRPFVAEDIPLAGFDIRNALLAAASVCMTLGGLELVGRLTLSVVLSGQNYDVVRTFVDKPRFFEEVVVDGRAYYRSELFPTRYYSDDNDTRGQLLTKVKTERTYRIFSFGGSSTAGSPFGHWGSFSRIIAEQLQEVAIPGVDVEIMNFGASGYGSSRAVEIAEQVMDLRPDLVILYMGHNEHCDNYEYLKMRWAQSGHAEGEIPASTGRIVASLAQWSAFLRVSQLLLARLKPIELPAEPFVAEACSSKYSVPTNARFRDEFTQIYESNVRRIADLAKSAGADTVMVSQFANHFIPPKSYSEFATHDVEKDLLENHTKMTADELSNTIEKLRALDPHNAIADYFEAQRDLAAGHNAEAYVKLDRAMDNDGVAQRFRPSYSGALRALHDPDAGRFFVDARAAASRFVPDGIIDGTLVIDIMHPTLTGQALVASTIIEGYFLLQRPRPDLFRFDDLRPESVWTTRIEVDTYRLICLRYLQLEDWRTCVDRMLGEHESATDIAARRMALRAWENAYFYAVSRQDSHYRERSAMLFPSPWRIAEPRH